MNLTPRRSVLRTIGRCLCLSALLSFAACSDSPTGPTTSVGVFTKIDFIEGTGAEAAADSNITVNYVGWLYDTSQPDGKGTQFDSNAGFVLQLGSTPAAVIQGWEQGIPGMRVGGQRRLIIPPDLAYGADGRGNIPKNATLIFDIALMSINDSDE